MHSNQRLFVQDKFLLVHLKRQAKHGAIPHGKGAKSVAVSFLSGGGIILFYSSFAATLHCRISDRSQGQRQRARTRSASPTPPHTKRCPRPTNPLLFFYRPLPSFLPSFPRLKLGGPTPLLAGGRGRSHLRQSEFLMQIYLYDACFKG